MKSPDMSLQGPEPLVPPLQESEGEQFDMEAAQNLESEEILEALNAFLAEQQETMEENKSEGERRDAEMMAAFDAYFTDMDEGRRTREFEAFLQKFPLMAQAPIRKAFIFFGLRKAATEGGKMTQNKH